MRIRSVFKHSTQAILEGALISLLVVGLLAGTAVAGKGGNAATGSGVSISVPSQSFGSTAIATVRGASNLYVSMKCSSLGETRLVAWERTDSNGQAAFQMGPTPTWSAGSATCVAEAGHFDRRGRWQIDASTSFVVTA